MNVVINKCFGGFGLSHEATMRYAELKGFSLYSSVDKRDASGRLDFDTKVPYEDGMDAFLIHYAKEPLNEDGTYEEDSYFYDRDIERDDPALVQVVKELGEKANDTFAKLEIVEIPDGISYSVEEYDGLEHIAETHRTW